MIALGGCSSPSNQIDDALDQAHSAVASAASAAELADGNGLPVSSARASASDALAELQDAESAVSELVPPDTDEQREALAAIRTGIDALLTLQQALAAGGDLGSAREQLAAADEELRS